MGEDSSGRVPILGQDLMGLFDTVAVELRCPVCGRVAEREVQFKHDACFLEIYRIGDFVAGAPAGQPLLRGHFGCPEPPAAADGPREDKAHVVDCWVHLDRGFLTDVTLGAPERPTPVAWWMLERAGHDALRFRRSLRGAANTLDARRRTLREGVPRDDASPLARLWVVESEEVLLQRLEEILRRAEQDAWPGPTIEAARRET